MEMYRRQIEERALYKEQFQAQERSSRQPVFTQLSSHHAEDSDAAWSPDGKWIAFTSSRSGNYDIWLKPAAGGEAVQLTKDPGWDRHAVWSPDGTELAFTSSRRTSTQGENPSIWNRVWTKLPFTSGGTEYWGWGTPNIWIISANGEELRQVTTDEDEVVRVPSSIISWSPDGEKIAFAAKKGGHWNIWTLPATGGPATQLTFSKDSVYDLYPSWSPDGKEIAFSSGTHQGGTRDIYIVPATGGMPRRASTYPIPSASGGTPRRVTTHPQDDWGPSWSPDGRWLAFASKRSSNNRNGDIWIIAAAGGTPIQLTHTPEHTDFMPRWSPDGKRMTFISGSESMLAFNIWIADLSEMEVLNQVAGRAGVVNQIIDTDLQREE